MKAGLHIFNAQNGRAVLKVNTIWVGTHYIKSHIGDSTLGEG